MNKLIDKPWEFTLFKYEEGMLLQVLCETLGLFQVNIWLNETESIEFSNIGIEYIDKLAKEICNNMSLYKERIINDLEDQ